MFFKRWMIEYLYCLTITFQSKMKIDDFQFSGDTDETVVLPIRFEKC